MEAAAVRQMGAHNAAMLAMASAVAALPARLTQSIYILVDGAILPEVNYAQSPCCAIHSCAISVL